MFNKNKCPKCNNTIKSNFDFCPSCGKQLKEIKKEDWGMLGKDDTLKQQTNSFDSLLGGNFTGGILGKMLNGTLKMLEKEIQKEQQDMNNQNPANKNFELFINGKKVNPKNIQVTRQPIQQNYQPQKRKAINLPQNKLKKFKDLVQEEPQTEIRRLSDLIIYEIKLPGVKTDEDISIQNLAGSIEIKAISKDKAYFKTITINLPITGYSFEKENLILELEAKN